MARLRFVHAADLHLDSPFTGLRSLDKAISGTLFDATFAAYENIVDLCISERVDALLVAGDIFDSADRSLRAQLKFVDGLNRVGKANVRSFICHGNHDPLDGWEAQISLPEGCHRFGAEVERAPIFKDEPDRAAVYGISYPRREVRENLVPGFADVERGPFNIGLLHANVDSDPTHDAYAPCSLGDLERTTGIDYWALGHVHTRRVLREANPTVVYPGNPQGRHPNERGPRGVYLVEVSDSGQVRLDFRAMDVVRWARLELGISGLEAEQSLFDRLEQELATCRDGADGRSTLFRLELSGRGPLHHSLIRPGFVDDLLERINETGSQERPFLWCERIQVSTASLIDREQERQRGDFVGDLVRLRDEWQRSPDGLGEIRENLQELYGRGNAGRFLREHVPTDDELLELMSGAEAACLAELLEEGSP
jgi:DNA repair exonuclease SbcCD nuclease subunit